MLTTPKDLSNSGWAILVLRLEFVSRSERAYLSVVLANEELGPRLSVGPAGRAIGGLDECVQTTFQVPIHVEGIVGAHGVDTSPGSAKKATPDICVVPPASAGEGAVDTTPINATATRVVSVKMVNRRFMLLTSCSVICNEKHGHPGARITSILTCIVRLLALAFPEKQSPATRASRWVAGCATGCVFAPSKRPSVFTGGDL